MCRGRSVWACVCVCGGSVECVQREECVGVCVGSVECVQREECVGVCVGSVECVQREGYNILKSTYSENSFV